MTQDEVLRKEIHMIFNFIKKIEHYFSNRYKKYNSYLNNKNKHWHFIESNIDYITAFIKFIKKAKIKKSDYIVDVGCGVSPILYYLSIHGFFNTTGIEKNKQYIPLIKSILSGSHIINKDAFNIDYKKFKVIYLYAPVKDRDLYKKLLQKIVTDMDSGSYIMDFYSTIYNIPEIKENFKEYKVKTSFYFYRYYQKQ